MLRLVWVALLLAALSLASPADGLTILPTFDGSITNDPNGAAMVSAINYAIQVEQSNLVDNVTVKIHFTNDVSVSLGQSSSWGNGYSYSNFLAALKNSATSLNDTNGYARIPNTSTDPLVGGNKIYVNKAPARLLGLTSTTGPDGFDSTIMLNMTLMNFTRPPANSTNYDLAQVAEHEMDEVLGISSDLPSLTEISPIDLFRFTTNLVPTYTTNGDNAYFSVDGTNLLARYNMNPNGDYGDWYSYDVNWLAGTFGNFPQVQDAFSNPGYALDLGSNELASLDVVGWTLASTVAPVLVPSLKIVSSGAGQFTLTWTNAASGFTLQESTNLASGAWAASVTGSSNPAVILSATAQKFYRLYKPATPAPATATTVAPDLSISPDQVRIHVTRPFQR
jgi:hypothetical protein